jgi:hypothetical protein
MKLIATAAFSLLFMAASAAGQLGLSLNKIVDITPLGYLGVDGAGYDDHTGRLWLAGNGKVVELDPLTGQKISSFSASVVPGLSGASALALQPRTSNLFLFGWSATGEVTQAGSLVATISSHNVVAAAFAPNGNLYAVDGYPWASAPGDGALHRVNQHTGAFETTVRIQGYTDAYTGFGLVATMAFDPATGSLYLLTTIADHKLLEVDVTTGEVLSSTSYDSFIAPIWYPEGWAAGMAFNDDGSKLFFSMGDDFVFGAPIGGKYLIVLDRQLPDCFVAADLGNGLPGTLGQAPELSADMAGSPCTVSLQLLSFAQGANVLVVGQHKLEAPFKGGVMVPVPSALLPNVFDTAQLFSSFAVDLSHPVLAGLTLYTQVWIQDPMGPHGYSASNGLAISLK